uniref:Uncharacterized protein n=1 Tax=Panagrolaimus superbus TaxID=310955 RepID=A0A914Z6A3_9BILA
MQYKSSQKVLNPNETSSAKSGVNKKASGKSSEEMAKGTNKLTLRRAKSPTYLEVQTNVSETGFKTIKSDKGSDRNE